MWLKSFYWLSLQDEPSFYVRLLKDTLKEIVSFLILFLLILMTFGNAVMILNEGRKDPLYTDYTQVEFLNVILNQYEMALGAWETTNYIPASQGGDSLVWILFMLTTLISQIMFLNMLIAVMGDRFDRNTDIKDQSALFNKI
jgi:hypothetical protein